MTAQQETFIQALALGLDPAWRRLPDQERHDDACALVDTEAATAVSGVRSYSYSSIGIEPGVDLLLWRMAPTIDALETAAPPHLHTRED